MFGQCVYVQPRRQAKEEIEAAYDRPGPACVLKLGNQPVLRAHPAKHCRQLVRFKAIEEKVRDRQIVLFVKRELPRVGEMKFNAGRPSPRQFDHPLAGIHRVDLSLWIQGYEHLQKPAVAIAQYQNFLGIPQLE